MVSARDYAPAPYAAGRGGDRPPAKTFDPARRLQGAPSTAAIDGHPLHPMLIPFPIAFLTTALVTDIVYRRTKDPFWARASTCLLCAGLATGATAAVAGATDFLTIPRARQSYTGPLHAIGNSVALALAFLNLRLRQRRPSRAVRPLEVACSALTAGILGVTGWLGGELSYRQMIGVVGHGDQHGH